MTTSATVQQPEAAPDQEVQGRSTIRFPYLDQDDAVEIARKIFEVGGNSCAKSALAAALKLVPDAGGFNLRVGTAKMFGLVTGEKKMLSLTELGEKVLHPDTEKPARAISFLLVPLYRSLYEEYEGKILPPNPALEAHIERLGVAPKQRDKARQVFQRSATQAGYFAYGNNRLVTPQFKVGAADPAGAKKPEETPGGNGGNGSGSGGGGKTERKLNPFIEGLLETLPATAPAPNKAEWSLQGRLDWLQTAVGVFNLIYKIPADETGTVRVTVEQPKSSGN
jgi:hypothetical protein